MTSHGARQLSMPSEPHSACRRVATATSTPTPALGLTPKHQRGGLGNGVVKKRPDEVLHALLASVRARRAAYAEDLTFMDDVVRRGTSEAREVAARTLREVPGLFGLGTLGSAL